MTHRGPRIGRPDRLAALDADDRRMPGLIQRSILVVGAQRPAPTVAEELGALPAVLDELAKRLAGVVHRARAGPAGVGSLCGARAGRGRAHVCTGRRRAVSRAKSRPMSRRAMPKLRAGFGQRLFELRRARGLSQERLGVRTGLSGKFLGEVERGEKSISLDNLARVARAVGVGLEAMVKGLENRRH